MSRVRIEIRYLQGVEDPEALTIRKNLSTLGYRSVSSVSSVKIYELEISDDVDDPVSVGKELAEKLLVNPVIHQYEVKKISE